MNKKIIIVTAPSGSGKTTLVRRLLRQKPELSFSVSAATRKPRGKEQDGVDYYFLSVEDFEKRIENHEFLEWQMVYPGKYYGTLNSEIERIWQLNQFPIVDIDVKGAVNVMHQFKGDSLSIFIKAPSMAILEQRLRDRKTEDEAGIKERLSKAEEELSFASKFDYILVNDDLEKASSELIEVVTRYLNS